jgi:4-diphosphocytidyl-2-C-methyl-D-erythritol kinase
VRTVETIQQLSDVVTPAFAMPPERVVQVDQKTWRAFAPAKLNLGLRVYPVRADGYHDLESWFVPVSWHDTLTFTEISQQAPLHPPTHFGAKIEFSVSGRTEGIPTDPAQNLVGKAAIALAQSAGIDAAARIELCKVLAPGGGLGGGSADAALTLVALNLMWGLGYSAEKLREIAAGLGSDVPFFVEGVPALCKGRGEVIAPMAGGHPLFAVLIIPQQGISTRDVFKTFDEKQESGNLARVEWASLAKTSAVELNEVLFNDLEDPAFRVAPWLLSIRDEAAEVCGQKVHMTGSGSTLFTLCPTGQRAELASRKLAAELSGNTTCVPVRILNPR